MTFDSFNLSNEINKALEHYKYIETTPIQEKVIPFVLNKKDIMAKAQTGSGKTASFVLPLLNIWQEETRAKKAKIKQLILYWRV